MHQALTETDNHFGGLAMTPGKLAVVVAAVFAMISLFVLPRTVHAQGLFGSVSGVVTDSSGAVVTGATVRVTNVDTNVTTTWKTNAAGLYNATSLNPGTYKVLAEAKGFKVAVANNISLEVNANAKVDLSLSVGSNSETVEVTAAN